MPVVTLTLCVYYLVDNNFRIQCTVAYFCQTNITNVFYAKFASHSPFTQILFANQNESSARRRAKRRKKNEKMNTAR